MVEPSLACARCGRLPRLAGGELLDRVYVRCGQELCRIVGTQETEVSNKTFDSSRAGVVERQTRRTQNPVELKLREGSNPSSGNFLTTVWEM